MKAFAKRAVWLVILATCAVGWVFLMSLELSRLGSRQGGDGSRASVAYVDESEFPRVTAYLSVVDGSGQPMADLGQEAFALTEDGIPVEIEDFIGAGRQPVVAILVIDRSGSMSASGKMEGAQAAAHAFLDQLQPGRDKLGVIAFNEALTTLGALTLISEADRQSLKSAISRLGPDGDTAFYDAVYDATIDLGPQPGRKVIIAMTDGKDNRSQHSLKNTIEFARENKVPLYTIGLGWDVQENRLEKMASQTGGRYYFSPDASQLAALYRDLAQALQNEYALTYTSPTPRRDGTRRDVAAAVKHPGAVLSATGDYNPGGVLSVTLNLPLLIGLGILLLGLLFLPCTVSLVQGMRKQAEPYPQPAPIYEPGAAQGAPPGGAPPQAFPAPPTYLSPSPAPPSRVPSPPGQVLPTCVRCGASLRPQARFCPKCGQPRATR